LQDQLDRRTRELKEALEQQVATLEVLQAINANPGDVAPVFEAILAKAHSHCGAVLGSLGLIEDETWRAVVTHGYPAPLAKQLHQGTRISDNPILRPLLDGAKFVQLTDQAQIDHPIARTNVKFGIQTLLIVPLRKDGVLIGTISAARRDLHPFTERQIALLENFAAQAAVAIENARLLNELRESLQQQTATADVLKVISRSTFDLQIVLDALVESATRLCEATRGHIFQFDGEYLRFGAAYGAWPGFIEHLESHPLRPGRGTIAGRAAFERRTIHSHDVLQEPSYELLEAVKKQGYRTVLSVPMLREGDLRGVITILKTNVEPFTTKQIELIETFADQAMIAIENVRLFDSVEDRTRELAKSLEELRTTQDRLVQTQKLALLGQLTAGIAHEIKNPLNFVNNFSGISAELIDELQETLKGIGLDDKARTEINELTDTLKSNFDKVVHHGRRADAIVKNMLQHSREGSGEHRVTDVNALVEESLNLAWHGARAETQGFEIKLRQSFDPSAGAADIFPQDIRRALLNVISNGFYAATERGATIDGSDYEPTLTASTKSLGDRVEIKIRDNGTGMTPDVKERMFNPFFTTKPTGEGTGLGLSISHDIIVKQHGGSIEVDTEPGEFTEIRVILPRVAVFV
jgi:signal transduction histidine kinase